MRRRHLATAALLLALVGPTCTRGGYRAPSTDTGLAVAVDAAAIDTAKIGADSAADAAADAAPTPPCGKVTVAPGLPAGAVPLTATAVAASISHACAVTTTGELLCWGGNCHGQLGVRDLEPRAVPHPVPLAGAEAVAVGGGFSCARAGPAISCWGNNDRGQLGLGDKVGRTAPERVQGLGPVTELAAGYDAVCAITADEALWCWGSNQEGQIGQDPWPNPGVDRVVPTRVGQASWRTVSLGGAHGCGIRTDGSLWCWGRNSTGQVGIGTVGTQQRLPKRVGTGTTWIEVDAAPSGTCARQEDQSLWCWGESSDHRLGFADPAIRSTPELRAESWSQVSVDAFHGCGLVGAALWCWGRTIEGQLAVGYDPAEPTALPRPVPGTVSFKAVVVGRFTTFALRDDGVLMATGANQGLLGLGTLDRPYRFEVVRRVTN